MVQIYGIYDPRNEEEIRYIGKTMMSLQKRMYAHMFHARHGTKRPLYLWMKKLIAQGVSPAIRVIEETTESQWPEKEVFWISHFKSTQQDRLLNLSAGGVSNLNWIPSEETRRKISKSNKGKPCCWKGKRLSEEHKRNIGKGGLGLKRTNATKRAISESLTGKSLTNKHRAALAKAKEHKRKPVLKVCLITGDVLAEYSSISEAVDAHNIRHLKTNLIGVCKGRTKTCHGFKWRYKNDEDGTNS
jgi:group I intron endonuclease